MRAGSAAPPGPAQVTGSPSRYPHSRCFQTRRTSEFRADDKLTKPSQSSGPPPHCSPQSSPPPPCLARLQAALSSHGHPHPTQYPVSVCRVKRKASKSLARGRRLRIQAKNTGLNLTSSARTRGPESGRLGSSLCLTCWHGDPWAGSARRARVLPDSLEEGSRRRSGCKYPAERGQSKVMLPCERYHSEGGGGGGSSAGRPEFGSSGPVCPAQPSP